MKLNKLLTKFPSYSGNNNKFKAFSNLLIFNSPLFKVDETYKALQEFLKMYVPNLELKIFYNTLSDSIEYSEYLLAASSRGMSKSYSISSVYTANEAQSFYDLAGSAVNTHLGYIITNNEITQKIKCHTEVNNYVDLIDSIHYYIVSNVLNDKIEVDILNGFTERFKHNNLYTLTSVLNKASNILSDYIIDQFDINNRIVLHELINQFAIGLNHVTSSLKIIDHDIDSDNNVVFSIDGKIYKNKLSANEFYLKLIMKNYANKKNHSEWYNFVKETCIPLISKDNDHEDICIFIFELMVKYSNLLENHIKTKVIKPHPEFIYEDTTPKPNIVNVTDLICKKVAETV